MTHEEAVEWAKETLRRMRSGKIPPLDPSDVMGMDYADYLKSPLWRKTIRPRVLERDGHKCRRCTGVAREVHHRNYERDVLEGRNDAMLVSLCGGCHGFVTFHDDGRRRTPEEQEHVLFEPHDPMNFPEPPPVNLRKPIPMPDGPSRMSSVQLGNYLKRYFVLRHEKIDRNERRKARREQKQNAASVLTASAEHLKNPRPNVS